MEDLLYNVRRILLAYNVPINNWLNKSNQLSKQNVIQKQSNTATRVVAVTQALWILAGKLIHNSSSGTSRPPDNVSPTRVASRPQ